ncbi:hypothetical protein GCM10010345_30700 [Streptomyces canarius]|uniref:Uncharacterized protein n=1 Tax=Streptomyces canarius TaxID=285453 RepID=A0ABQ3CLF4_9ACTN|nr:hypothetical protein GCM10010345_30700 [Streptomyces canarius]
MVQRAQAHPVLDLVGPAERPPAHVGGLQSDRYRADPAVVSAEGAPVLVGGQHHFPHPPVPLPAYGRERLGLRRFQVQADGFAQFPVQGGREVQVEQQSRDSAEQIRFAP